MIVDANLHSVEVVLVADAGDGRISKDSRGGVEVVVLIFDLRRPSWGEHVFQTAADGVAGRLTVGHASEVSCKAVVVTECDTALSVDQARTPGVAEAAGDRSEPVGTIADRINAIGEAAIAVRQAGDLAFDTNQPVRSELVVSADLAAAEEGCVTVAAGQGRVSRGETVIAAESRADVRTDVNAGPIVDRRRRLNRCLGVAARTHVGGERRR